MEAVLAVRDGDDRLSKLSDSVLGHILSFLPAFEAARAAVLSRRWRDIFAAVHTVSLDERERPVGGGDDDDFLWPRGPFERRPLSNVVSAALLGRQRRGGGAPLRELRVAFRDLRGLNHAVVDRWLSGAARLAGDELQHLDLRILGDVTCSLRRHNFDGTEDKDELFEEEEGLSLAGEEPEDESSASPPPHPRAIPVPRRLFSCVALRSLRLGPCRLDDLPPTAIDLPSLETLLLTRVVGPGGLAVQRLISACPRLADLTLEACANVTALRVHDKRLLRKLALRCCHDMTAVTVDATELRVFEYRGDVPPGPAFLTLHGRSLITSCTLDLCGSVSDLSALRDLLKLFAGVNHLHLKSSRIGFFLNLDDNQVLSSEPVVFPETTSIRQLELTGIAPDNDAKTIVAAVTNILERTPSLETLSLFFLPELLEENAYNISHEAAAIYDDEAILDVHQLRYDRHAAIDTPVGAEIPCLRERISEINLVHYQGGESQRALAKFLLRHALVLDHLCCALARGPLWMQCKLMQEIRSWAMNKSAKMMFV